MSKLLTISVAAYNIEKYIENTLNSLIDDRYVDKLEVFIIDDGGTDNSYDIAKQYELKYPNTFHAVHKDNEGYGSTVNYSISHATGKYFKLLDGDDWMDNEGLYQIIELLEKCDDDIVVTDYYMGPDENNLKIISSKMRNDYVVNVKDYETSFPHGMWSLFYKTIILKESIIPLPKHTLYTDQIYSTLPFSIANTIHFYNIPVYCYRFGREDQSTSKVSRIKHADEMFRVCEILYDFYEKEKKKQNKYLLSRVSRYYVVALKTFMLFPVSEINKNKYVDYEKSMMREHNEIYNAAIKNNKMGQFIRLLRISSYKLYWLIRYLPDNMLV